MASGYTKAACGRTKAKRRPVVDAVLLVACWGLLIWTYVVG